MKPTHPRSMLRAIEQNPEDAAARLRELRLIVAKRLDDTESARETASLARVMLDIESAFRALTAAAGASSPVDDLLARRAARGAK